VADRLKAQVTAAGGVCEPDDMTLADVAFYRPEPTESALS
jgi:hypothetical protein